MIWLVRINYYIFLKNVTLLPHSSESLRRDAEIVSQESYVKRSSRGHMPQHHLHIEGKDFMITPQDEEPRDVEETFSFDKKR